jgi:hypothetical protein
MSARDVERFEYLLRAVRGLPANNQEDLVLTHDAAERPGRSPAHEQADDRANERAHEHRHVRAEKLRKPKPPRRRIDTREHQDDLHRKQRPEEQPDQRTDAGEPHCLRSETACVPSKVASVRFRRHDDFDQVTRHATTDELAQCAIDVVALGEERRDRQGRANAHRASFASFWRSSVDIGLTEPAVA